MELEVYGSYATPLDGVDWFKLGAYFVSARCAARCHSMREAFMPDRVPDTFDESMREHIMSAFLRVHPEVTI